jgi:hypothetical protein
VTPRGLIDRMIASVPHRHSAALIVLVADLNRIADVVGIELDQASRHP